MGFYLLPRFSRDPLIILIVGDVIDDCSARLELDEQHEASVEDFQNGSVLLFPSQNALDELVVLGLTHLELEVFLF